MREISYPALKAVNVGSTKEILKMVCSGRPKFLHYVSTIGVFAPLTPWEHIDESTPPSQDRSVENNYVASYFWPYTYDRPGMIHAKLVDPG